MIRTVTLCMTCPPGIVYKQEYYGCVNSSMYTYKCTMDDGCNYEDRNTVNIYNQEHTQTGMIWLYTCNQSEIHKHFFCFVGLLSHPNINVVDNC